MTTLTHNITNAEAARNFMLAGNAIFTLVSKRTGTRYTYRVRAPREQRGDREVRFAALLTGPNNERDYRFIGTIFVADDKPRDGFAVGRNAPQGDGTKALEWFLKALPHEGEVPATVEFWTEGRCGRCGRTLTVDDSIELGLGPICAQRSSRAA